MALRLIERKFQDLDDKERRHNEFYHGREQLPKRERLLTAASARPALSRSSAHGMHAERAATAATTTSRRLESLRSRSALDRADGQPEQVGVSFYSFVVTNARYFSNCAIQSNRHT